MPIPQPFTPIPLPPSNQRTLSAPHPKNTPIPLALTPTTPLTLQATIATIQTHKDTLTALLATHGALLFRSLPIHTATEFSLFAHAFGLKPHEIIGVVVDRPVLAPNVSPANAAPPSVQIYNHNESPQVPHAPEYIFFWCDTAPKIGGETCISSSLELFHRVRGDMPEFIDQLAEKGVLSRVVYSWTPQYRGGATLMQAFGKEVLPGDSEDVVRRKVEGQIRRYGRGEYTTWEWSGDGVVVRHLLPAIRTQRGTNLPSLFTGLATYYKRVLAGDERLRASVQVFGDGSPIPERWLERLVEITEEIRVLHRWVQGDVLVFDNVIAQHGREPWEGEQGDRVVLASLWDGEVPGPYGFGEWARLGKAVDGWW